MSAIAKPGARGFRTPSCLDGLSCSDIIPMNCETPGPDILARLRQAYRQVDAPRPTHVRTWRSTELPEYHISIGTYSGDGAAIGLGFFDFRDQVDLTAEFDFLSCARKCAAISDAGRQPETATRFIRQSAIGVLPAPLADQPNRPLLACAHAQNLAPPPDFQPSLFRRRSPFPGAVFAAAAGHRAMYCAR